MLAATSFRTAVRRGGARLGRRGVTQARSWASLRRPRVTTSSADNVRDAPTRTLRIVSSGSHSTAVLAAYFASASGLAPGDCYLLFGPVGAGKSHFSRAFIRYAMDDDDLEVPSPTFLLHNMYERKSGVHARVHHYDLYRLSDAQEAEFERLELSTSIERGISLIEWPERLVEMGGAPAERIEMEIALGGERQVEYHERYGDDEAGDDERARIIEIRAYGGKFGDIVELLASHVEERGAQLGLSRLS